MTAARVGTHVSFIQQVRIEAYEVQLAVAVLVARHRRTTSQYIATYGISLSLDHESVAVFILHSSFVFQSLVFILRKKYTPSHAAGPSEWRTSPAHSRWPKWW